ncbi:tetratricopeptide repeat protein [Chryseobacterium tructae]|uniref:tetratricopeptide repeat protein n=1 Tax=Chryseobacterium tructae TaxID=1037380 RepID=UPI0025B55CD5|nr:tetratricopeptide repeat protein [Chryseobacterium tructae]MDN3692455.1 tetratricopeptide repeat protein [Chryseobacterium tructae]
MESQLIKSNMYMGLSDYYAELGNYETSHLYIDKSITISEKISQIHYFSSKRIHRMRAFIYFYKSSFFLEENKPVLAYPFIRKAYNQAVLEKYKYMVPFHEIYGDYYFKTQNYQKAIDFYLKCLEEKRKFKWQHASGLNTKISRAYKMLGDHEKQIYYLEKAEKRHSFDLKNDHKIVEGEMDRTLIKKQVTESKLVKNNILFVVFLFLLFTVLLVIIIAHHQSVKKKNSELMDAQKMILYKRESEIKEREETIGELQRKVNDSFSELINLAKNNSPYFFCRFQEVYPDFCTKMLEINPMLKSSELIFCAYIYLRFSTKEIAEYTFKAIKTIENNRYNLRKRLRLAPQEDLMIWIRKYIDAR